MGITRLMHASGIHWSTRDRARQLTLRLSIGTVVAVLLLFASGCGSPHIDYVDFIHFNGVNYIHRPAYPKLPSSLLGQSYAKITAKLQDNGYGPDYRPKDGNAAFLAPGTVVSTVNGYRPTFRLAVHLPSGDVTGTGEVYYEAESSPQARIAGDWLDIRDKVAYIGVIQDDSQSPNGTQRGAIADPKRVSTLVNMLLDTPFGPPIPTGDTCADFVSFHLVDGTETILRFTPQTGAFTETLRVPSAFTAAIQSVYTC